ncbi:MAG: vWA domain-containing protein [Aureliella sp.]
MATSLGEIAETAMPATESISSAPPMESGPMESVPTESHPTESHPTESLATTERRDGNTIAFLTSLVFHTALLLVLACWVLTAGKPSQGLLLSAEIGETQSTDLEDIATFDLSLDALDSAEESLESETSELEIDVEIDTPITPVIGTDPSTAMLTSVASAGSVDAVLESLKPVSDGRGASFFGAYAEGNRFIYVLDSSRSMLGDRWVYACTKLIDSLNGLKPGQEFYVICFDMETTLLFNGTPQTAKFYPADDETIERVQNWLRSRILGRATMPAEALTMALKFNPDAIFLLSDGELQDNSRMLMRRLNSNTSQYRQIPIHTVHLFSAQGKETLKAIARENKGSFTPIEGHKGFGTFRSR